MIRNALFVSVWDGDTIIETPCKICSETNEVYDIVSASGDGVDVLDDEYIEINGIRHPVVRREEYDGSDGLYWYD